jgi:hypothetical protein
MYLGIRLMKDRERGKTDGLRKIPMLGNLTMVEWWMPKSNHGKNIVINKAIVLILTSLAFLIGTGYGLSIFAVAVLAVLFETNYFEDD